MIFYYPTTVYIIGAGGFGRELADWAATAGDAYSGRWTFTVAGFVDNNFKNLPTTINDVPVIGGDDELEALAAQSNTPIAVLIGVGTPSIKKRIYEKLFKSGKYYFPNLIGRNSLVGSNVSIQENSGVIITPGNIITCNIKLGAHVMINLSCTLGHDCVLEDFVTLSPGVNVSGNVHIKEGAYLGTGSSTVEKITIGEWSVLGGQAFAAKDIPANSTCVGVPAKQIKTRPSGWHL
jgi:sugar O-acyltransferase (sialic acid O-acetyltransferase NeuD family)